MFQPYVDKENASQLHVMAPGQSVIHATPLAGKVFQSATPIQTPARKILGNLNARANIDSAQAFKGLQSLVKGSLLAGKVTQQLNPPISAAKHAIKKPLLEQKTEHKQKKPSMLPPTSELAQQPAEVHRVEQKATPLDDEIEFMPPAPELEDDFEDIWPRAERPETYLQDFNKWRPTRFLPLYADPDSDSDEAYTSDSGRDDIMLSPYKPANSDSSWEEEFKMDLKEETSILDLQSVRLPPLDDTINDFVYSSLE